ncbi:hypothetical protein ACX80V_12495 [Arthrobacter sp. MDT3-24]
MSADRHGLLPRLWEKVRRSFLGGADGGKESAVVDPSLGNVQLQLTVWEQRL